MKTALLFVVCCIGLFQVDDVRSYQADTRVVQAYNKRQVSDKVEIEIVTILYRWKPILKRSCNKFSYHLLVSPDGTKVIGTMIYDEIIFGFIEYLLETESEPRKIIRLAVYSDDLWWVRGGAHAHEFEYRLGKTSQLLGYSPQSLVDCLS